MSVCGIMAILYVTSKYVLLNDLLSMNILICFICGVLICHINPDPTIKMTIDQNGFNDRNIHVSQNEIEI